MREEVKMSKIGKKVESIDVEGIISKQSNEAVQKALVRLHKWQEQLDKQPKEDEKVKEIEEMIKTKIDRLCEALAEIPEAKEKKKTLRILSRSSSKNVSMSK